HAEGILRSPQVLRVEDELLLHPADLEDPAHPVAVVPDLLDLLAAEADGRMALHVEEVGAAEVVVPSPDLRVDARRLDLRGGREEAAVLAERHVAAEAREAPMDLRHDHVPNGEADVGMGGIDLPGGPIHVVLLVWNLCSSLTGRR